MSETTRTTLNSYTRHDGYVMTWEKRDAPGAVTRVSMMDDHGVTLDFPWHSRVDPVAGQKVSVLMVDKGVSARADRPILVLNHDTGETIREQNAPSPTGARPIMLSLAVWVLIAMAVSCLLIAHTEGLTMMVTVLVATAIIVWRFAIATSELRYDERAQQRIQEEERLCLDTLTGAWRLANNEAFQLRREEA